MPNAKWVVVSIVGAIAGCGASTPEGGDAEGGEGPLVYSLDYDAGPKSVVDFHIDVALTLSAVDERPLATLPEVGTAGVAKARSVVNGSNVQNTEFTVSSGETLEGEVVLWFDFELSRGGGGDDGERLDAGEPIQTSCYVGWDDPTDANDLSSWPDCEVERNGDGYTVTLDSALITGDDEESGPAVLASGTISFSPVPGEPFAYTVWCPEGNACLSLDGEVDPATGWCIPEDNLRSSAGPCDAECANPLTFGTGDEEVCVCSSVCGRVDGGSPDLPTCDPAYGCIDF
jgi:hypothetical protein